MNLDIKFLPYSDGLELGRRLVLTSQSIEHLHSEPIKKLDGIFAFFGDINTFLEFEHNHALDKDYVQRLSEKVRGEFLPFNKVANPKNNTFGHLYLWAGDGEGSDLILSGFGAKNSNKPIWGAKGVWTFFNPLPFSSSGEIVIPQTSDGSEYTLKYRGRFSEFG